MTKKEKVFKVLNKTEKTRHIHIKFSFFPIINIEIFFLKIKINKNANVPNIKKGTKEV